MKSRKALLALAAVTVLGGCAAYPYDDYAYQQQGPYYYRDGTPYYAPYPGYYVGPSVGFGITYGGGYRHHHYR